MPSHLDFSGTQLVPLIEEVCEALSGEDEMPGDGCPAVPAADVSGEPRNFDAVTLTATASAAA
jgi:hypothetical protein